MRRKGLIIFILAWLPWLCLAVLSYLGWTLWGAVAGLVVILLLFFILPSRRKWGILQAFSLLFFLVACAAALVLGDKLDSRIPNLLAGGFACLVIMAGYGALENMYFPGHYLYIDYPESMRESPVLRRTFWSLTMIWNIVFLMGLAVNLVCMLALRGDASTDISAIASAGLICAGILLTPFVVVVMPRRMESELVEKGPLAVKWKPPVLTPGRSLRKNEYDAAVVGSGIGGLSCAALLSHSGMKVLLAEKARGVGGYCQTFCWEGYPLNSGPSLLCGGRENGVIQALIQRLGLEEEIPMRRLEWGLANGKIALRLGQGPEQDMDKIGVKFPTSKSGLKHLMTDLRRFRGELMDRPDNLSSPLPSDLDEYHEQFLRHPLSALWQNLGFQALLEEYITDDELVSLLGGLSSLLGGDPKRFPAFEGARLLCNLFIDGIFCPQPDFSHLSRKLAGVVRAAGGDVMTSCASEEVLLQGEGARAVPIGLRLSDGSQIRSKVVILNVDPRRAIPSLVPPSSLGFAFLKEMEKLKPSCSAFVLHFIFQDDLRLPERVFLFPSKPRRIRTGDTYLEVDSLIMTKEIVERESGKGCVLMVRINVPSDCYHVFEDERQGKELGAELTVIIKEEIASVLPAIKNAAKEFVTLPTHFSRLTSNVQGSAFGFAPLLSQWYYRRPGPRLPLHNLYLVGAWSRYGGGLEGAALSGIIASRELCGERPYASGTAYPSATPASAEPGETGEARRSSGKLLSLRRGRKRKRGEDA
ncbi:MAG: FAD-dependent oxidoreductase [Actinomycetota bacterium]|nr:FAD-dependent oxidoreductase [Actinomycetota bacterium]